MQKFSDIDAYEGEENERSARAPYRPVASGSDAAAFLVIPGQLLLLLLAALFLWVVFTLRIILDSRNKHNILTVVMKSN